MIAGSNVLKEKLREKVKGGVGNHAPLAFLSAFSNYSCADLEEGRVRHPENFKFIIFTQ